MRYFKSFQPAGFFVTWLLRDMAPSRNGTAHLEAHSPILAAKWFGDFALTYLLNGFLGGSSPPPINAADLEEFGKALLKDIKVIVANQISDFEQLTFYVTTNYQLLVLTLRNQKIAEFRPNAEPGDLSGLQGVDDTIGRHIGDAYDLLSFLTNDAYSGFAASYYIVVAAATMNLNFKDFAASSVAKLETHFIPSATKTIGKMYRNKVWRGARGYIPNVHVCWMERHTGFDITVLSGEVKRVFRTDPIKRWRKEIFWSFGWRCSDEDYEDAFSNLFNVALADKSVADFKASEWGTSKLLWDSEIGATLLTSQYKSTIAGMRFAQEHGTLEGYAATDSSIDPCNWFYGNRQFLFEILDLMLLGLHLCTSQNSAVPAMTTASP
ncbi:hypothetical protein BDW02DRAFT_584169 [Decorospora gaudefroyi]|uniref:Uncharacterized protein n=1 Tax=Decorospora gaudefroyi TaxID=184978 RepID=A0A6A5JYR3_9PLEO|nr:hypothetical protein BDW02DRAFT_584169 [Decorospora gaudefroyi]